MEEQVILEVLMGLRAEGERNGIHSYPSIKSLNLVGLWSILCDYLYPIVAALLFRARPVSCLVLPVSLQLDVHQQHILRCYMRRNNMDNPPPQSSPHKHKRIRKRSTSVVNEDKMDRLETSLLAAGVKPEWLKVHRIISKRYARGLL